ncbi:MAG: threonine synthase [Deltaproteobacteria bacterium]|nr:MAG: threonine synthase [Deltaproteobacteria bacterium]
MQYFSTRGGIKSISFTEAVMMGLAEDGGLLLPRTIPRLGSETINSWENLDYHELAYEIMRRFIEDIPESDLKDIIFKSYENFGHKKITPIVKKGDLYIMELFHGPTLAFKDVALQFLGNLFEYLLKKNGQVLNILGATSGDTGSAAIYGVRGKKNINIFILHPHERISPVQERQMTTVMDENVFNIAIRGTFDDGQSLVKQIFNDLEFKQEFNLGAINSINWARVLAQVVYYVHAFLYLRKNEETATVDFAVPTGNFGDIFAGYIARKLLPEGSIRKLILATNSNDILTRFVKEGDYSLSEVKATSSPSMDIQAASNFERYLYYLMDSEAAKTKEMMEEFAENGKLDLSRYQDTISRDFSAAAVNEEEVLETIKGFAEEYDYILDPHTAVGVKAALDMKKQGVATICLATAHPAKFGGAVAKATGQEAELPASLADLMSREAKCKIMDNDAEQIKAYLRAKSIKAEIQPAPAGD